MSAAKESSATESVWRRICHKASKGLLVDDDFLLALERGGVIFSGQVQKVKKAEEVKRAKSLFRLLREKESNEGFVVFLACLRRSNNTNQALAWHLKEMMFPPVKSILTMSFGELRKSCSLLGITSQAQRVSRHRIDVLESYDKAFTSESSSVDPPVHLDEALVEIFRQNKEEFCFCMEEFKSVMEKNKEWLERLQLQKLRDWVDDGLYQSALDSCTSGIPTILFAGSTSSGKSTLLNALLGDNILPTDYNSCSSALCTVLHHSSYRGDSRPNGSNKFAVVHLELHNGEKKSITFDLLQESQRKDFKSIVGKDREQTDFEVDIEGTMCKYKECYHSEVYWTMEWLKYVNIVDSPGVTENSGDSLFRNLTADFQKRVACGFVYVLDASKAAEEAIQAGGLFSSICETCPAPGAALFVLNKWDLLENKCGDELKNEYEAKAASEIGKCWANFNPERQLFKLNSKTAYFCLRLGFLPDDMKAVCTGLAKTTIPCGMNALFLKHLWKPRSFVAEMQQAVKLTIQDLELPDEEKRHKQKAEQSQLAALDQSLRDGEIAAAKRVVSFRINKFASEVLKHLKKWRHGFKDYPSVPERMRGVAAQYVVRKQVCVEIQSSNGYRKFCSWLQDDDALKQHTKKIAAEFHVFKSKLAVYKPPSFLQESTKHTLIANEFDMFVDRHMLVFSAVLREIPTYAESFSKILVSSYESLLKRFNDYPRSLEKLLIDLAGVKLESVRLMYVDIPNQFKELKAAIEARHKEEKESLAGFKTLLADINKINAKYANFIFQLKIHKISKTAVSFLLDDCFGHFGDIQKVSLHGTTVAMKVGVETVNYCASDMEDELEKYRKFTEANLIKFLGSVGLGEDPLKVGFLFEWEEGQTLEQMLMQEDWKTPHSPDGLASAKEILQQTLRGIDHLHSQQIAHLNIRSSNIIILKYVSDINGKVKLGCVSSEHAEPDVYTAPEIAHKTYLPSPSADMYSFGVVMWELWIGKRLEQIPSIPAPEERCVSLYPFEGDWLSMVSNCWKAFPTERLDAKKTLETVSSWDSCAPHVQGLAGSFT